MHSQEQVEMGDMLLFDTDVCDTGEQIEVGDMLLFDTYVCVHR